MIDRLVTGLRTLATLPLAELAAPTSIVARSDLADALRLELDCPQQSLMPRQRDALVRLGDLLDSTVHDPVALQRAVRDAYTALDLRALGNSPRER